LTSFAGNQIDELARQLRILGSLERSDRIGVDSARRFGKRDGGHLVARTDRVGDVDDSGVGLAAPDTAIAATQVLTIETPMVASL